MATYFMVGRSSLYCTRLSLPSFLFITTAFYYSPRDTAAIRSAHFFPFTQFPLFSLSDERSADENWNFFHGTKWRKLNSRSTFLILIESSRAIVISRKILRRILRKKYLFLIYILYFSAIINILTRGIIIQLD